MARPRKQGQLDWFKLATRWDEKMEALLDECGAVGGFAMTTIWQNLYSTSDGRLNLSSEFVFRSLAKRARCTKEELARVIEVACDVGLLCPAEWQQNRVLSSPGVDKRLQENEESREVEREKKTKGKPRENSGKQENTGENSFSPNCSPLLLSSLISSDLISSDLEKGGVGEKTKTPAPPERREVRPLVYLTESEQTRLEQELTEPELTYWLDRLEEYASKNPAKWRKGYQDHNRVIRSWRNRKLEEGYQWNEQAGRYEKAPPQRGSPSPTGNPHPKFSPAYWAWEAEKTEAAERAAEQQATQ